MNAVKPMARRVLLGLALASLTGAGAFAGHAVWMQAKARLAQYLIADAWQKTLATGERVPPWPWADTWPVARLTTPAGEQLYVLAGLTGEALAFGPAQAIAGPAAGERGTTIIAGHKNTHFHFLQYLEVGDIIRIHNASGEHIRYRVVELYVADSRTEGIPIQFRRDEIVLVTCYPFGPGHYDSPLRYVVRGVRL